ncbi:hypothetical protein GC177_06530 [bacterium]|nr:hypothetical protein [bacterium]
MIFGFSELSCNPLYPRYLAFRHQVFNELLQYHLTGNPVYLFHAYGAARDDQNMEGFGVEYDDYDIPKTLHLAFVDASERSSLESFFPHIQTQGHEGTVRGCLRFLPTDGPYMIKDNIERGVWKHVRLLEDLPAQANIYEASRIAVDPRLGRDNAMRETVLDNLVYNNVELAVRLNVPKMVGIMYDRVWTSVYRNRGVPIRYLSEPFHVDDGPPIIIGEIITTGDVLDDLNRLYSDRIEQGLIRPATIDPGTLTAHQKLVQRHYDTYEPLPRETV